MNINHIRNNYKLKRPYILFLVLLLSYGYLFSQRISLPIEVLGTEGTIRTVKFELKDGRHRNAKRISILANNLSYANKGSIRLNNGPWIRLNNSNIKLSGNDKAYGGIGGGLSSVQFTIPMSGFVLGMNKVDFRFDRSDKVSIGYRVVKFNVLNASNNNMLSSSVFRNTNPQNWKPPIQTSNAINQGKNLWYNKKLRNHNLTGNKPINARCTDCHAQDGRDLKYFNYSNFSIIKRSEFHGLTKEEGKKIASYIRSLNTPAPKQARPWNPPYQPGPSIAGKPVSEWSAGAGLDAVLTKDKDMISYVFPQGTGSNQLDKVIDSKKTLDLTTIPIALQFPDWKRWLPVVHPKDVWVDNLFDNSSPTKVYNKVRDSLKNVGVSNLIRNKTLNKTLSSLNSRVRIWLGKNAVEFQNGGSPWRTLKGGVIEKIKLEPGETFEEKRQFAKLYLAQWMAVKYWELMQEFELEDKSPMVFDKGEKRGWPYEGQGVHPIAPHIGADNINNFPGQSPLAGDYLSSAWYQLQMTINSGHRSNKTGVQPVDWPYQNRHIQELAIRSNVEDPMRYITSLLKMYQVRDNGAGPTNKGWTMRNVHPFWLYSGREGDNSLMEKLDDYQGNFRNRIVASFLKEWIKVSNQFDEEWIRETPSSTGSEKWHQLDPIDYKPTGDVNSTFTFRAGSKHADNLFKLIPLFRDHDLDCNTINNLIDWAKKMWPKGDWNSLADCNSELAIDSNIIKNSNFNNGLKDWMLITNNSAKATVINNNQQAELKIESIANTKFDIQLSQRISVEKGFYALSFNGKSDKNKPIELRVSKGTPNYVPYFKKSINLNRQDSFKGRYLFFSKEASNDRLLQFGLGHDNTNVSIDNVKMIRYTTQLQNGYFTNNLSNWSLYKDPQKTHQISLSRENQRAKVAISNGGNQGHHIQLYQNTSLKKGVTYLFSFNVFASQNRSITAKVQLGDAPYSTIGDSQRTIIATKNPKVHYIWFTADKDYNDARVQFNLGGNNSNVFLDNVLLLKPKHIKVNLNKRRGFGEDQSQEYSELSNSDISNHIAVYQGVNDKKVIYIKSSITVKNFFLYDLSGKKIFKDTYAGKDEKEGNTIIRFPNLSTGIYILKIKDSNNNVFTKKIVL